MTFSKPLSSDPTLVFKSSSTAYLVVTGTLNDNMTVAYFKLLIREYNCEGNYSFDGLDVTSDVGNYRNYDSEDLVQMLGKLNLEIKTKVDRIAPEIIYGNALP
jgi:hypothetical protein